jgi:hypothetical protein
VCGIRVASEAICFDFRIDHDAADRLAKVRQTKQCRFAVDNIPRSEVRSEIRLMTAQTATGTQSDDGVSSSYSDPV